MQQSPDATRAVPNDPLDQLAERAKRCLTTGNVPVRLGVIVSFIGVGVLLLIVGYFAPAPPRAEAHDEA